MKVSKRNILPNGCECTTPQITPKNWKKGGKELLLKDWRVQYYFYDEKGKKHQIRKKGMNEFKTLRDRREATQLIYDEICKMLFQEGYNPITKIFTKPTAQIEDYSTLHDALMYYYEQKICSKDYKVDIKSMLDFLYNSIVALGYKYTKVKDITRRDVKKLLKNQQMVRGLSNNRYNKYVTMLSSLFDDAIEDELIDYNPTYKIKKLPVEKRIREILTNDERNKVYHHLKENYYTFWRFMMVFYSSGARERELLNVQIKDVDLLNLRYKVLIKKGQQFREVYKPINVNYAYLWREVINEKIKGKVDLNGNLYLFSRNLQKGEKSIRYEQITRRWKVHVKDKLGITADFYSLKHLYSDEVSAKLDIQHAQRLNSHTTDRMMRQHYAVNEKERQMERLRNIDNSFTVEIKEGLKVV